MAEHVVLDLPLSARYASAVRAVAASIAAEVGLSIREIDDLRLGVNEAISVLTDVDPDEIDTESARLRVRFEAGADRIDVAASRSGVELDLEIDGLARKILSAVVDEFAIVEGVVTLTKHVSADVGA